MKTWLGILVIASALGGSVGADRPASTTCARNYYPVDIWTAIEYSNEEEGSTENGDGCAAYAQIVW